jgi:hypothetical protein
MWKSGILFQGGLRYKPNPPPMNDLYTCLHCGKSITKGLGEFSIDVYGVPLCLKDQVLLIESDASQEAKDLFLALRYNNIPVELQYHDGNKTFDIAIPGKLYIEVDTQQQIDENLQLTDLLLNSVSTENNIPTIKIPHGVVRSPNLFKEAVDGLTDMYSNLRKAG